MNEQEAIYNLFESTEVTIAPGTWRKLVKYPADFNRFLEQAKNHLEDTLKVFTDDYTIGDWQYKTELWMEGYIQGLKDASTQ